MTWTFISPDGDYEVANVPNDVSQEAMLAKWLNRVEQDRGAANAGAWRRQILRPGGQFTGTVPPEVPDNFFDAARVATGGWFDRLGTNLPGFEGVDPTEEALLARNVQVNPGASLVGNLLPEAASAYLAPARVVPQAAIGGAVEALRSEDNPALAFAQGAAAAGLGQKAGDVAAGWMGGRQGTMHRGPGGQEVVRKGEALGYETTPAMRTGDPGLIRKEAGQRARGIGPYAAIDDANEAVTGRVITDAIGESGKPLSPTTINDAFTRTGAVFDNVVRDQGKRGVVFDMNFDLAKQRIRNELADITGNDKAVMRTFDRYVDGIERSVNPSTNAMTPQKWQRQSHILGQRARTLISGSGDTDLGRALRDLREELLNQLERSAGPEAADRLREVRKQYRALMLLMESRPDVEGMPSMKRLGNVLGGKGPQSDRPGYLRGLNDSDLYNAARFVRETDIPIGSTTARNIADPMSLQTGLLSGVGAGLATGDPTFGLASGVGTYAATKLLPSISAQMYANPAARAQVGRLGSIGARFLSDPENLPPDVSMSIADAVREQRSEAPETLERVVNPIQRLLNLPSN